jgi:translocation and assembly module TamB
VGKLGAQSLLAQGIGSVVSTGVAKFAGLPHFSIDPALRGNGQDPGARVTVQQRVTSNLYVTYSTDVTSTQRPAIEVDYRLSRKWSVHGTRDQNGGMGFSAKFHKDF